MTAILSIKPEDATKLHPAALKWFNNQSAMIEREVAHYELTYEDLETFLSDDEVNEFVNYKAEIGKELTTFAMDSSVASRYPLTNASIGFSFMLLQLHSFSPIQNIESSLKKAYARKTANEFSYRLNQQIAQLTSQLDHTPRELSNYFRAKTRDKRLTRRNFDYTLSVEDKDEFDAILVKVVNEKLHQFIPYDLRQFIAFPSQYHRLYFPLPTASYRFEEVPYIDFIFEVFAAACVEISLKPGKKSFGDCEFPFPQMEEKGHLVPLQKPKFLGYHYLVLRPEDLGGYVFWQSVPLILLRALLAGETKPEGTRITAASDEEVTYRIPNVEDEITIPNSFAEYLKTIGTIDQMISMNILTDKVASIAKSELNELEQKREFPSLEQGIKQQDTKKATAYQLFDEGKRPSDPEVKALSIKPDTAYRYFQSWKKARNCSDL